MTTDAPRTDIVTEIARTFRANGFHGTTLSVVSERTGLGRSSIYHHFGRGKVEMAQRSLDTVDIFIGVMGQTIRAPDVSPQAKWETIEAMLRAHYERGRLGCLLAVFALDDVPEDLRLRTKVLFDHWLDAMADLHRAGGASAASARRQAERSVGALQGALVLSQALASSDPFEWTLAEIGASVADLHGGHDGR